MFNQNRGFSIGRSEPIFHLFIRRFVRSFHNVHNFLNKSKSALYCNEMGQVIYILFFIRKRMIKQKQKLGEGFEKGSCGRAGEIANGGDIAVPPLYLLVV